MIAVGSTFVRKTTYEWLSLYIRLIFAGSVCLAEHGGMYLWIFFQFIYRVFEPIE